MLKTNICLKSPLKKIIKIVIIKIIKVRGDKMEYIKGEYVKYANNGVCLIDDICVPDFDKSSEDNFYYVLKPLSEKSTVIFVPVKNSALLSKMRKLLTKQEIDEKISSIEVKEEIWIDDRKKRTERFNNILKSNDTLELLRMVGCIYMKKQELAENKISKKLSFSDIDLLERAEKMIDDEFSFVLNIDANAVGEYIRRKLGN